MICRPRIESLSEEQSLNPVDRKAPPNDDNLSQKIQADTDSTHSSSVEDVSHSHGPNFLFLRDNGFSSSSVLPFPFLELHFLDDNASSTAVTPASTSYDHFAKEGTFAFNGMKKCDVMRRNMNTALAQTRRLSQDR